MKATVRQTGKVSVVDLSGRFTIGEGDTVLRQKIRELLENGQRQILLNLEEVPYMDSTGIGELIASYKDVKKKGGTFKLVKVSARVQKLLELTRLDGVLETFRDEKEALGSS